MSTRREFINQTAAFTVAATATAVSRGVSVAAAAAVPTQGTMRTYKIPHTDLEVSRIAAGCELLVGDWSEWNKEPLDAEARAKADLAIKTAYENGITLFDLAEIYAFGKAEMALGEVLKRSPGFREKIVIQTKCGIHLPYPWDNPKDPLLYDSSYDKIVGAAEGSLKRLSTDRLDILLLHRPDPLGEPHEVARAFDELHRSGKVRYFGVSNHTAAQIDLLKKYVRQPLVVNQVQIGLMHPYLITEGIDFNLRDDRRLSKEYTGTSGTLDYCRLNEIQIQAWGSRLGLDGSSPGMKEGRYPTAKATMDLLTIIGEEKRVSAYAMALAWLLRHPADILPLISVKNLKYIADNCLADKVSLTREEWYSLLLVATGAPSVP